VTPDQAVSAAMQHAQSGRMDLAIPALQEALRQDPNHVEANKMMGIAMLSTRPPQPQQGMVHIDRAIAAAPSRADLYHLKGEASAWMGNIQGAIAALERSVELNPGVAQTHALLATCLLEVKDLDGAEEEYLAAIRLQPNHPEARTNYATILTATARPAEAVRVLRETAREFPNHLGVLTNYCVALNYAEGVDPEEVRGAHEQYGRVLMGQPGPRMDARAFPNPRDPERKLRVGLVSPDLFDHSVAYFVRAFLEPRDRVKFEYVVYATGGRADQMTRRIQQSADGWREMRGVPDGQLIEQIRGDRVDILVELSGQTHGNKLGAVRLRGAPVQVTYCGYPNTTGVPAIDYRIVDALTDPAPAADRLAVEKLIRLDPCFLCYTPREDAPPIAEPPSRKNGSITFGSFNSLKKVTPSTLALWCRLVRDVPGSRLVIKSGTAFARSAREYLTREILSHGLAQTRFDLLERNEAKFEHLATYEQVDIGLDTFPYHGTTTTCEAMWQGVPVVSLVGDVHAARVGLSLLSAVGLAELAARTPDEYLEIAMALAADPARRASIRSTLRPRMQASVLCNAPAFARRFEGALRHAWRAFCAANPA
jgi:protein O-GlcNAc transferase